MANADYRGRGTGLGDADFEELAWRFVERSACHTLFILDCCLSGAGPQDLVGMLQRRLRRERWLDEGRSVEILAACGTTQAAVGGGFTFSQALIRVLALTLRGRCSGVIPEIAERIRRMMRAFHTMYPHHPLPVPEPLFEQLTGFGPIRLLPL